MPPLWKDVDPLRDSFSVGVILRQDPDTARWAGTATHGQAVPMRGHDAGEGKTTEPRVRKALGSLWGYGIVYIVCRGTEHNLVAGRVGPLIELALGVRREIGPRPCIQFVGAPEPKGCDRAPY